MVDAGGEPGGSNIAPGNGHRVLGAVTKINVAALIGQRYADDAIILANAAAVLEALYRGFCRAGRQRAARVKTQCQAICVRQFLLESGGDTVGRDDVKANARANHDVGLLGIGLAGLGGDKGVDFAGDIQVVTASCQTGVDQRLAGG